MEESQTSDSYSILLGRAAHNSENHAFNKQNYT